MGYVGEVSQCCLGGLEESERQLETKCTSYLTLPSALQKSSPTPIIRPATYGSATARASGLGSVLAFGARAGSADSGLVVLDDLY
jgi:hypothetical protein